MSSRADQAGGYEPAEAAEAVPFETIPALAASEDYIAKMDRLRELRALKDQLFNDDERKGPLGEYEGLKREVAAMQAVQGAKSIVYYDLRVTNAAGGVTKGKVTGRAVVAALLSTGAEDVTKEQLHAIADAAKDCDSQDLLSNGIPAGVISAARTPDKPRAGSIRVEFISPKAPRGAKPPRAGEGSVS